MRDHNVIVRRRPILRLMNRVRFGLLPAVLLAALLAGSASAAGSVRHCPSLPWHVGTGYSAHIRTYEVSCTTADRVIRGYGSLEPKTVHGFYCTSNPTQDSMAYQKCVRGSRWIKWTSGT